MGDPPQPAVGDPVELELRGYRVCVRAADLAGLRVAVANAEA